MVDDIGMQTVHPLGGTHLGMMPTRHSITIGKGEEREDDYQV